ncbi:hypothetical protein [Paraburkholderia sp. J94]|uniref:hypothetical protein n=1 Tax=Paraburkholderia sp. J94 TaxID=2805441 RepID=UPI002AB25317|nr:hypothetical protein [Paraburkholderia sp. J94]
MAKRRNLRAAAPDARTTRRRMGEKVETNMSHFRVKINRRIRPRWRIWMTPHETLAAERRNADSAQNKNQSEYRRRAAVTSNYRTTFAGTQFVGEYARLW